MAELYCAERIVHIFNSIGSENYTIANMSLLCTIFTITAFTGVEQTGKYW
jgi:hypothetical protein